MHRLFLFLTVIKLKYNKNQVIILNKAIIFTLRRFNFMCKIALFLCIIFAAFSINAQTYNFGLNSYSFLNSIYSARSAGLGSNLITISDKDIGLSVENPSLLNKNHVRIGTVVSKHGFKGFIKIYY